MEKTAMAFVPLFATYRNRPFGETASPSGLGEPAPVEKVAGLVAVNTPLAPMVKPDTLCVPEFAM
jgi:hypothetical protein